MLSNTVEKSRKQQEMKEIMQKTTEKSGLYQRNTPERSSADNVV